MPISQLFGTCEIILCFFVMINHEARRSLAVPVSPGPAGPQAPTVTRSHTLRARAGLGLRLHPPAACLLR